MDRYHPKEVHKWHFINRSRWRRRRVTWIAIAILIIAILRLILILIVIILSITSGWTLFTKLSSNWLVFSVFNMHICYSLLVSYFLESTRTIWFFVCCILPLCKSLLSIFHFDPHFFFPLTLLYTLRHHTCLVKRRALTAVNIVKLALLLFLHPKDWMLVILFPKFPRKKSTKMYWYLTTISSPPSQPLFNCIVWKIKFKPNLLLKILLFCLILMEKY